MSKFQVRKKVIYKCLKIRLDTQAFFILNVFLKLGYTANKLQSVFDGKNYEQKSQIARRKKEKIREKKINIFLGLRFWL